MARECRVNEVGNHYVITFSDPDRQRWFEIKESFKALIPRKRFVAAERCWLVDRRYAQELRDWALTWYTRDEIKVDEAAKALQPTREEWAYRVLHLTPGAPEWAIIAAYKAAVKAHHPDRGGDETAMKAVNNAMDVLRGRE